MEIQPSPTSLNRPRMTYDVFISFRGEDTRKTIVGYLYDALRKLGIMTFMDDKKLLIGDNLSDELFKAIQESRSSIVVLSKDYASSKWCLKELAKIIDTMGETTHRVLPVFYHVEPSDVRYQCGSFQKSFDEHEKAADYFSGEQQEKYLQEVQIWKESFTKIANLTGEVVTPRSAEVDIVNKITNQIFDRWRPKLVTSDKNLVGMAYPLRQMNVQLGLGLDDVRFVGMVGMGGIGKTTIAKVVFDCIASKFEGSCFLRLYEGSSKKSNLVSLQVQLLSRLFPKENVQIWDEDFGAEMIGNQLRGRKILLVLDGIEEQEHLEMLAGSPDWFGPGSRVIITTRNKQVLSQPYEIREYNVKLLDSKNALQLFCNHAFGIHNIDKSFENISMEMVEKLGRLPLALKVIGSYLNKKNGVIWKETLNRIIKVNEKMFQVLKISYDGLGPDSQKVFLDLACFFNGRKKDKVVKILESFGYSPYSELHLFMERCLIEILDEKILMHDLIVALGQEVVRQESGRRSRIWLQEDVARAFAVKHGLKYTEGIVLNLGKKQADLRLEAELFECMTCLRILEISDVKLSGNIKFLSNLLGLLNWPGYPSESLPPKFQSAYLIELHLPNSSIVQLWEGTKEFEKLKVINVSGSEYLLETPDFSKVPNLESLDLGNCRRLSHIHPSINGLNRLSFLNIKECPNLKNFSSNLRCTNLGFLVLSDSGLTSFPEIEGSMEHLSRLHLDKTYINTLHSSIKHLVGLVFLDLNNCTLLSSLPSEIGNLKSLEILILEGCVNLNQIPPSLGNAQRLQYLNISKTSISGVPSSIHCLKNLRKLICDGLSHRIWHSLLGPCNIQRSDSEIFDSKFGLESLEYLSLRNCNLVEEDIPEDLHRFSKLRNLDLSGNNFVQLPKSINQLTNLKELKLHDCFALQHVPNPPINLVPIISGTQSGTPIRSFPIPNYLLDDHFTFEFIPKTNLKMDSKAYEESIFNGTLFSAIDDKAEVLDCFKKIREGNSIEVDYHQIKNDANNIYGVILSACIQLSQIPDHEEVITFYTEFVVELKMEEDPLTGVLPLTSHLTSRTRFWMLYIPLHMLPQCRLCFKIDPKGSSRPSINVQKCGVFVLTHQNASSFLGNMFNAVYNSTWKPNKFYIIIRESNCESKCTCGKPETVDQYCSSTQYVENDGQPCSLLKKNLESILRRVYEEEKHLSRSYFFPQGKVSSWFRIQQPKDTVAVKLPLNLFREKKWLGLAVFAIFSVHVNSVMYHDYAFNFQVSSNEDGSHWREGRPYASKYFFVPLQLLQFSPQILFVSFVPRNVFPYLQERLNHFYVSFITNAERLQVELCGARLVYQHNVEGLIHTILDCVPKNGQEVYHGSTSLVLRDMLLTPYRQRTWPFRVPSDEPTTSTSSDLGRHLSYEELVHESFQHPLLKKNNQKWYQMPKFHAIFTGKFPEFVTNQSWGNEVTTRIPERLYFAKNEVVVLICAVIAINRQIAKPERTFEAESRRVLVVDLKCEFGVDSHKVEPKHHIFVPLETLLSRDRPSFIWLSSIQFAAFHDLPWLCCNYLSCKISTNDEELFRVQQCGLHLLHAAERSSVESVLKDISFSRLWPLSCT